MIVKQNNFADTYQDIIFSLFWLGFIIYSITHVYIDLSPGITSFTIPLSLQTLGLILIFSASLILIKWRFENGKLKAIFIIYILWLFLIILRGLSFDLRFIKNMLFNPSYGVMPYLVPLILLFPREVSFYKKLFSVIIFFGFFYLIFIIIFGKYLLIWDRRGAIIQGFIEYSSLLSIPAGFILLTYKYHTSRIRIFSVLVFVIGLLMAIYGARRNLIFIYTTQILFFFLLYLSLSKRKFILIMYSVFLSFLMVYYLNNSILKKDNPIFSYLTERGMEDTRTGVELAFYADFDKLDWIIGRGISGTYYCPGIEKNRNYRYVIETGYLQMILRGGIISLVLILLITIPSAFLGLFYSNNTLSKAAGIWILLWVLYLYPTTMEAFSLFYIIFWISIGICNSKNIRNMSDIHIIEMLHAKKKEPDIRILFDYHY